MAEMAIAVLTDFHYIGTAKHTCGVAVRQTGLAPQLLEQARRAVQEADVVVLGGDLTDNGMAEGALEDLQQLRKLVQQWHKPVLTVRGNHDAPPAEFEAVMGKQTTVLPVNGYQIIGFSDRYQPGLPGQRDWAAMERIFAQAAPDVPVITVQHSPLFPRIQDEYPYNLADADAIGRFYACHGVVLSISGHLHRGNPLVQCGGVSYVTCPALCEPPFPYTMIYLQDEAVSSVTYGCFALPTE